ncbi:MAG: aminotransferase class I/II-fold pyridoxal phosphate-dependent enzyme [Thermodesulfobacteriota bacterium]|nr:aminotransferase class I/II-fold pyridoxal phosphate-dependent enzyme [Thermodesulfobacteriota bacterium]
MVFHPEGSGFHRMMRLPPYIFGIVNQLKMEARRKGEDIIDLGMGNPDLATPKHIVNKLIEAVKNPKNHRYSASKGIHKLRLAITNWYRNRFDVDLDPESEAVVTIGAKEGIGHLVLATLGPGDVVLVPDPTYPIHAYSVVIAGGDLRSVPLTGEGDFFERLLTATKQTWPHPKMLIVSFPHNPTTKVVDLDFFERLVEFAKDHRLMVVHDLAYADIVFDGYRAPSLLQVNGAKEIGVEMFSLSKSYNMAGWRVGFAAGNPEMLTALARLKSYFDYGVFQPIQIAAIIALNEDQACVREISDIYKRRRDTLIHGLKRVGWEIEKPKGTMFVWAEIPKDFQKMGSLDFTKFLLREGKVAVSPGIGFGECGEGYVRFALVENEPRIKQAVKGIQKALK